MNGVANKSQTFENRSLIKRKSNKEKKQIERKPKRENLLEEDTDTSSFSESASTNRKYVDGLNLHENKNKILLDSKNDFELIGSLLIGEIEQKTNIRLQNFG